MKRVVIISIIALTFCGSCHRRFYLSSVQDSVRVDTRIEYIEKLRDTTVYVEVPREVERVVTRDTVSHLENTVAVSDAVVSGGLLFHSLETKPASLPATVQVKDTEISRDSTDHSNRTETIIQEVNRLTWWQRTQLWGFKLLLGIALLYLVYKKTKHLLTLK